METTSHRQDCRGFTLTELLVAVLVVALVIGGVALAAVHYARMWFATMDLVETQHNIRVAAEQIHRDLRTAGYGLHQLTDPLANWLPGITNRIVVRQGTTAADPDELTVVGAQSISGGRLQFSAITDDTTLTLDSGGGGHFNTTTSNLVVVGGLELARVIAVSGDTLTISKDPSLSGIGLSNSYPVGSPVERISYTTYECITTNLTTTGGLPYLVRYANASSPPSSIVSSIAALGVENLQIVEAADGTIRVTLTGRAAREDPRYTHPVQGDHFRRYPLEMVVSSLN